MKQFGFIILPIQAAIDTQLTHADFRLLAVLSSYADSNRIAWPSNQLLAEKTGFEIRSIQKMKSRLEGTGYLRRVRRYRDNGSERSSYHQMAFDLTLEAEKKPDVAPKEPVTDPPESSESFNAFYGVYPRRVGRGAAERAYNEVLKKGATPSDLAVAAERFAELCKRKETDTKYIPHPATWLNGQRWLDEDITVPDGPSSSDEFAPVTL